MNIMACMNFTSLSHGTGPGLEFGDKQDVASDELLSVCSHMYIAHNRRV